MPNKVEKEEREEGDAEDVGQADKKDKTRQHDSGAADLEKVNSGIESLHGMS